MLYSAGFWSKCVDLYLHEIYLIVYIQWLNDGFTSVKLPLGCSCLVIATISKFSVSDVASSVF